MPDDQNKRIEEAILETAKTYASIGKEEYAQTFLRELADKYLYEGKSIAFILDVIRESRNK
jgi:hypothetical protein